jgi:dTDP-4-amino-4,6-dideoxygalactose transaminase
MEAIKSKIPFADLKRQYQSIEQEVNQAIQSVLKETAFIGGRSNSFVQKFETEYSEWMNIEHTVSVANGTDAIEIILSAWGIGPGDEVIVPALTWFSTAEAVISLGAKPVFTDVLSGHSTLDPEQLESLITPNTKAIIPVHLYGQMAKMEDIMFIAELHKLKVLEDCAQSHGAERLNRKAGTWGHAAAFSFYPGKNLGAYGDAGAICTKDSELAEICRQIANHGQRKKHDHLRNGRNSRLDGIQAAVLSVKLPYLNTWNEQRRQLALQYFEKLNQAGIQLPKEDLHNKHVYHLFVVHHSQRDELVSWLAADNIETALHYPYPIPSLAPVRAFIPEGQSFPVAQLACSTLLSLPMFPELRNEELQSVCNRLLAFPVK